MPSSNAANVPDQMHIQLVERALKEIGSGDRCVIKSLVNEKL